MPAQQTTYSLELPAPSQPGFVTNSGNVRVKPFRNDNVAAIPFGRAVCRSANTDLRGFDTLVTTRQFLGVLTWGQSQEAGYNGASNDGAAPTEMQGIMEQGEVLVETTETVTPESPVRVRIAADANIGKFCTTLSAANTALVANAKFVTGVTGAGVVKVALNGPGPIVLVADA